MPAFYLFVFWFYTTILLNSNGNSSKNERNELINERPIVTPKNNDIYHIHIELNAKDLKLKQTHTDDIQNSKYPNQN